MLFQIILRLIFLLLRLKTADYLKTSDKNSSLQQAKHLSLTDEPNFFVSSWSEDKQWILIPAAGFDFSNIRSILKSS